MTVDYCDGGCGKVSPTIDRLFIANAWVEITVLDRERSLRSRREWCTETIVVCKDCATTKTLNELYVSATGVRRLVEESRADKVGAALPEDRTP